MSVPIHKSDPRLNYPKDTLPTGCELVKNTMSSVTKNGSTEPIMKSGGASSVYRLSEMVTQFLLTEQECWGLLLLVAQEVRHLSFLYLYKN